MNGCAVNVIALFCLMFNGSKQATPVKLYSTTMAFKFKRQRCEAQLPSAAHSCSACQSHGGIPYWIPPRDQ